MQPKTSREKMTALWRQEMRQPFAGWDFSHLDGRMVEERPPWSYHELAKARLRDARLAVDLGTGGAERFLKLRPYWPEKVAVTEEYPPNVQLARQRLAPYGVPLLEVRLTDDDPMPFADAEFDLVLNRHAAFNPAEVSRVLSAGGCFLTQQVHGLWAQDLLAHFGAVPQWPDATPAKYIPQLEAAGLTVTQLRDWSGQLVFHDTGALVYYLKAVPWLVPGFALEAYGDTLWQLQAQVEQEGPLSFQARKYLIEARRTAH